MPNYLPGKFYSSSDVELDEKDIDKEKQILAQIIYERGREYCNEYEPAWPVTKYNGMCKHYLKLHRPCGVPFINSQVCKYGITDNFGI